MPETLHLIDGHALAYRAYFALSAGGGGRWMTSSGEPTAGVYGFTSVLLRLLEQEDPDYLAVAFDTGKTFRDEIFPEYKATRAKMPEDLRPQIERIRELVDAFGIPRLELEGYEADDVLGSAAHRAVEQGMGVKIFTGDRDLLQLVDERIIVNLPGRSLSQAKDYLPEDVLESLGVRPDQVVDYKALMGDSSDNIPGVRGVGKKTAVKLLAQYDTLDGVYAHLDELSPGLQKKLKAGREDAYLSQKLATIITDLQITLDLQQARPDYFDSEILHEMFRQLEFRTLMARLRVLEQRYGKTSSAASPEQGQQLSLFGGSGSGAGSVAPPAGAAKIQIVDSPKALENLVARLSEAKMIAFDTETTSTDKMRANLVGISLAIEPESSFYIPVGHAEGRQLPLAVALDALRPALTAPEIPKAGHNLKYDFVLLARHGLRVKPLAFDTMLAEWLINPSSRNLGLKNLVWARLGYQMTEISALIGKGKSQKSMADVPIADAAPYAGDDAAVVLRLIPQLRAEMERDALLPLFDEIEMPLISVLAEMEMAGIGLDVDFLAGMSRDLAARLQEIEDRVYEFVGTPFNLNSTQQLSRALFETLKLSPPDRTRKTASGHYSTAAGVLEAMRTAHPVVDLILEHRELAKLKSTYADALPQQVNPRTGRVHTSYNQAGSVTGRLASSDPNLQNIPIRTELGRRVRRAFIAGEGNLLLAVDYSQVELRIVAHMAQDEAMLAAFRSGQDIHATTAAAIFNVPLDAVTKAQRRHAKAINFGLIYGMSPFGLTRSTDLTLAEAENFVDAYFKKFPGVKKYLDDIREQVVQQGYVDTLLGRRRYFRSLQNPATPHQARNRALREAINTPIQGTAADIMKIAMLRVHNALADSGLEAKMLLQVHDEIVLECSQHELTAAAQLVQETMESAYPLDIPLRADVRSGSNWGELTEMK